MPFIKATWLAVILWVLGVSARLAFALYAQNGGGPSIAQFSASHHLTIGAWAPCLIVMALVEVVSRSGVLIMRRYFPKPVRGSAAMTTDGEGCSSALPRPPTSLRVPARRAGGLRLRDRHLQPGVSIPPPDGLTLREAAVLALIAVRTCH